MAVISAIQAAGGDYATPDLWEASLPGAADQEYIGEMADEVFETSDLVFNISAGDAVTLFARLRGQSGSGYDGTAGSGPVLNKSTGTATLYCIRLDTNNMVLENFEITNSQSAQGAGAWYAVDMVSNRIGLICYNILVHDVGPYDDNWGWKNSTALPGGGVDFNMWLSRCGAYGLTNVGFNAVVSGLMFNRSNQIMRMDGCSFLVQGNVGVEIDKGSGTSVAEVRNCVVVGGLVRDFFWNALYTMDNNVESGTDLSGNGNNNISSVTPADQFVSVVAATEDLHMKAGADGLQNGLDRGADAKLKYQVDMDGYDVDASAELWDRGVDQFNRPITDSDIELSPIGSSFVILGTEDPEILGSAQGITVNPIGDAFGTIASDVPVIDVGENVFVLPGGSPLEIVDSGVISFVPASDITVDLSAEGDTISALEDNSNVTSVNAVDFVFIDEGSSLGTILSEAPPPDDEAFFPTDRPTFLGVVKDLTLPLNDEQTEPGLGIIGSGVPLITVPSVGNIVLPVFGNTLQIVDSDPVTGIFDTDFNLFAPGSLLGLLGSGAAIINIIATGVDLAPPGSSVGILDDDGIRVIVPVISGTVNITSSHPTAPPGTAGGRLIIRSITRDVTQNIYHTTELNIRKFNA